jgi:hypothetical protein
LAKDQTEETCWLYCSFFKIDIHNLWAKSFYQKIITSATELENVIYYVNNNRKKHGLAPLTSFSTKIISTLVISKKE